MIWHGGMMYFVKFGLTLVRGCADDARTAQEVIKYSYFEVFFCNTLVPLAKQLLAMENLDHHIGPNLAQNAKKFKKCDFTPKMRIKVKTESGTGIRISSPVPGTQNENREGTNNLIKYNDFLYAKVGSPQHRHMAYAWSVVEIARIDCRYVVIASDV